jgi:hypothetical protein
MEGTGGTYICRNITKRECAVFKPIDEEAFAPNNPRGHEGSFGSPSFRPGVLSGEAVIREVAASIVDKGVSNVLPTVFAEARHPSFNNKMGDLEDPNEFRDSVMELINPDFDDFDDETF